MTDDTYDTTFSKEIELIMPDYISASLLKYIAVMISERVPVKATEVQLSLSTDVGAQYSTTSWNSLQGILEEAKKYNRTFGNIFIKTGIVSKNEESKTHYSIDFRIQRITDRYHGFLSVYGVAGSVEDSQHIIDWGSGIIKDFGEIEIRKDDVPVGAVVIDSKDGSVHEIVIQKERSEDKIQKVEVVNPVEVVPQKWSDKSIILTVLSILVAVILAIVGWIYFGAK